MPNGVVVWGRLSLMGVAVSSIFFMDAFENVLGKCFVDVGTKVDGSSCFIGNQA
jgi:hypothetical protein